MMRNYVWHGIAITLIVLFCSIGMTAAPEIAIAGGGKVADEVGGDGSASGDPDMPDGGKDPNSDQEVSDIIQVGDGNSGVRAQPDVSDGFSLRSLNTYRLWMQSMAVVFRIQLGWF